MNWTKAELDIYNKALANVQTANQRLARVYMLTQKEVSDKLKKFFLQIDPSWSKAYQAKRLAEIFKDINQRLSILAKVTTTQLEKAYLDQYRDIFNRYDAGLTELFKKDMPDLMFSLPAEKVIMAGLNKKVGEYSFLRTMAKKRTTLLETLKEQVAISLNLGENPTKLSKRLKSIFEEGILRASVTARTELLKSFSLAQEENIKQAEDQGIEFKFKWLGRNDGREREAHVKLNNTFAKYDKSDGQYYFYGLGCKGVAPRLFVGANQAAMNINCRCRKVCIPIA